MIIQFILAIICFSIIIKIIHRGYFWKDKEGKELTLREFFKRWGSGVVGITPLQQKRISLWSFLPLFAGILWGIAITIIAGTYWMALILGGSLPLTIINFISTYQQYRSIKIVEETMRNIK